MSTTLTRTRPPDPLPLFARQITDNARANYVEHNGPTCHTVSMAQPLVIYVDVDDTLVRSAGTARIPVPSAIRHVQALAKAGAELYLWSTGGGAYARATAAELDLVDCFAGFLPKPNVLIDDQPISDWRRFVEVHPMEVIGKELGDYADLLGG